MRITIKLHSDDHYISQRIAFDEYSECDDINDIRDIVNDNLAGMLMGRSAMQTITAMFVEDECVIACATMVWEDDSYTDASETDWEALVDRLYVYVIEGEQYS